MASEIELLLSSLPASTFFPQPAAPAQSQPPAAAVKANEPPLKKSKKVSVEKSKKSHKSKSKIADADNDNEAHSKRKQSEFLCLVKYRNRLPEPPMYPKLLQLPDTSDSFCNVKITTLDARVGVEFNLDADTPMIITDFVNPSALGPDTSNGAVMSREDSALMDEISNAMSALPVSNTNSTRFDIHSQRKNLYKVPTVMLRKPQVESRGTFPLTNKLSTIQEEPNNKFDLRSEIRFIEESFEHVNKFALEETESRKIVAEIPIFPFPSERSLSMFFQADLSASKSLNVDYCTSSQPPNPINNNVAVIQNSKCLTMYNQDEFNENEYHWSRECVYSSLNPDPKDYFLMVTEDKIEYAPVNEKFNVKKRLFTRDNTIEKELISRPVSLLVSAANGNSSSLRTSNVKPKVQNEAILHRKDDDYEEQTQKIDDDTLNSYFDE